MMYEVTFKLPGNVTYITNIVAENKETAEDIANEELWDNITTEIKESKIDGNAILNWVADNMPNTDKILFRTDNTAIVFNTYDQAQMVILAEHLYSAFEDFAKDNFDENCNTVEGLFNYCTKKEKPDFGDICTIYYEDLDSNFVLAF